MRKKPNISLQEYDRKGIWGKKYEKVKRKEEEKMKKKEKNGEKLDKQDYFFPYLRRGHQSLHFF
jgi:hypothetical protein